MRRGEGHFPCPSPPLYHHPYFHSPTMTLNERYTHILSYFRESQPTVTTEL